MNIEKAGMVAFNNVFDGDATSARLPPKRGLSGGTWRWRNESPGPIVSIRIYVGRRRFHGARRHIHVSHFHRRDCRKGLNSVYLTKIKDDCALVCYEGSTRFLIVWIRRRRS